MNVNRDATFRAVTSMLLLASLGCSNPFSPDDIQIRIGNESAVPFDDVDVIFPSDEVDYGHVPSGGVSEYRRVEVAYAYARIDVRIGATKLWIQPIDYVGEPQLRPGRYTYALNVLDGRLTLELKRD